MICWWIVLITVLLPRRDTDFIGSGERLRSSRGAFAFFGYRVEIQRQKQRARAPALQSLVQEVLTVESVSLGGAEAGVADDAAEFFFSRAVGYACGSYYIFF